MGVIMELSPAVITTQQNGLIELDNKTVTAWNNFMIHRWATLTIDYDKFGFLEAVNQELKKYSARWIVDERHVKFKDASGHAEFLLTWS